MIKKKGLNEDSPSAIIRSTTLYNALDNLNEKSIEFKFKGLLIRVVQEEPQNRLGAGYVNVICSDNLFIENLKWASNYKYYSYNSKERKILYDGFVTKVYRKIYINYIRESKQTKEEKKINRKFNKLVPFYKRILIKFLELKEIIKNLTYHEN